MQAQYAEFCGWLHEDAGDNHLAVFWTDRALGLAHLAGDHDLTVYILARTAGLAGAMRVPADAISAGEQALRMAPLRSRFAAYAATWAGRGHALSGNHSASERTYEYAHELLGISDVDSGSLCGPWLNETSVALNRAWSLAILGDYHTAAQSFQNAIADLPSHRRRDRGVYLTRAALIHADAHEVEHAATVRLEALTIGTRHRVRTNPHRTRSAERQADTVEHRARCHRLPHRSAGHHPAPNLIGAIPARFSPTPPSTMAPSSSVHALPRPDTHPSRHRLGRNASTPYGGPTRRSTGASRRSLRSRSAAALSAYGLPDVSQR